MQSFDDLELRPELVEALAGEGIEVPTAIQREAIPLVRRGRSVLLEGGPGGGIFLAYSAGILESLESEGTAPRALILAASRDEVEGLALSLARLATSTGHRVAALDLPWPLPEHADLLLATPEALRRGVEAARVKLDGVRCVVGDGLGRMRAAGMITPLEAVLSAVPQDAQRIFTSLPVTTEDRRFIDAHTHRAVLLPSDAGAESDTASPHRGEVRYRVRSRDEESEVAEMVTDLLDADHDHVLLFFRSDDRAADVGDILGLRGYAVGPPGDRDVPVWLGVDALEARSAVQAASDENISVASVSIDVPADADTLDRRHSKTTSSGVLVGPRELAHLRKVSREAGYSLKTAPVETPAHVMDDVSRHLARVRETLEDHDLTPHVLLLEPLFQEWSPQEVAGALSHLVRAGTGEAQGAGGGADAPSGRSGGTARPPAWVRLFLSIGERDQVRPGDLVGAITGEAEIEGSQVGRIEIRDTFSRVDVEESVAGRVIRALNGTTLRGRSVRADYDREDRTRGVRGRESRGGKGRGDR